MQLMWNIFSDPKYPIVHLKLISSYLGFRSKFGKGLYALSLPEPRPLPMRLSQPTELLQRAPWDAKTIICERFARFGTICAI